MTITEPRPLDYDENTPQTEHGGLAAAMYGPDFLAEATGPILNVAAGNTDLRGDLQSMSIHQEVVSVDPIYASNGWYQDKPDRIAATAGELPYPDDTFAVSLCQYGMQHIADKAVALREMVRVTKPAESVNDTTGGTILVSPVFKPKELADAIFGVGKGLELVCGIQDPPEGVRSRNAKPTLVIKKTSDLSEERLSALIEAINQTGALDTRRTLGEMASRFFGGHSKY